MKAILILASVLGLSASAALAECAGHEKINASVAVDKEFKTASIIPPTEPAGDTIVITKKTDRLPATPAETK
jgi:predicted LPLAT superfamily acyltransferase